MAFFAEMMQYTDMSIEKAFESGLSDKYSNRESTALDRHLSARWNGQGC